MFLGHSNGCSVGFSDSDWSECIKYFSIAEVLTEVPSIIQIGFLYSKRFIISVVLTYTRDMKWRTLNVYWMSSFTLHESKHSLNIQNMTMFVILSGKKILFAYSAFSDKDVGHAGNIWEHSLDMYTYALGFFLYSSLRQTVSCVLVTNPYENNLRSWKTEAGM